MEPQTVLNCFLCCGEISRNPEKCQVEKETDLIGVVVKSETDIEENLEGVSGGRVPEVSHSLLDICRYLKLEQVSGFGKEVRFCGSCGDLVERLSELCRELERVKLKVLQELRTFDRVLKGGLQQWEETQGEIGDARELDFKKDIKLKCNAKLQNATPKVTTGNWKNVQDQSNPDQPSKYHRSCNQCGKWIHKNSLRKHRTLVCAGRNHGDQSYAQLMLNVRHKPPHGRLGPNQVECEYCHKIFVHKHNLDKHKKELCLRRPDLGVDRLGESEDGFVAPKIKSVSIHVSVPAPVTLPGRPNTPEPQNTTLPSSSSSRKEIPPKPSSTSTKKPDRKCNLCGVELHSSDLFRHKRFNCKSRPRLGTSDNSQSFACDICGLQFQFRSNLDMHKQTNHADPTPTTGVSASRSISLPPPPGEVKVEAVTLITGDLVDPNEIF